MIFQRLPIVRFLFQGNDQAASERAARWSIATRKTPELARDLIELGGVLQMQPVRLDNGVPQPDPIDPHRLAYEAGQRDMALQLLALSGITPHELSELMEEPNVQR